MPWTLYRYILREVLKLLVLATVVLVTVVSFAAAIKPLSDGLLSPTLLLKWVAYASPTMLGFALPFAAALASTLVFIRMASENEVAACSASGMSYASVLGPVAALGLVLTMGLFLLSNFVAPSFSRATKQMIENDLMTVLVSQLNRDRAFDGIDGMVLYADSAEQKPPPTVPGSALQPERLIELHGVVVGQLDQQGRVRSDTTAQHAGVLLYRDPATDQSWITIGLANVMRSEPARGVLVFSETGEIGPVRLPNPFRDDPKFLSYGELRELGRRPEQYDQVRRFKRELARAVTAEQTRQAVLGALGGGGGIEFAGPRDGEWYTLRAAGAESVPGDPRGVRLLADDRFPVQVRYRTERHAPRRIEAAGGTLRIEDSEFSLSPSVWVELSGVRVYDPSLEGRATERQTLRLPRMLPDPAWLGPEPEAMAIDELAAIAESPELYSAPPVASAYNRLRNQLVQLRREVIAQLHERAASAVACLLLIVLGGVLSISLRSQLPLVVYFWSFLLAVVILILIYSGQNMATDAQTPLASGLAVLWSGNALLAVVLGTAYCRLARH